MAATIHIRTATRADLSAVDALLARAYPRLLAADYPPSVLVTALPIIARARPELLTSGSYYLATDEGGAVWGAGGWSRGATVPGTVPGRGAILQGTAHVRHLVTDDRHTRQGVGRSIMERVMKEAAGAGVGLLDCLSTRTAVPFYLAMGFTALGAVIVPLRPGIDFPAVRMQRAL